MSEINDYAPIKGRGDIVDLSDLTPEDELIFDRLNGMTAEERARANAEADRLFDEIVASIPPVSK